MMRPKLTPAGAAALGFLTAGASIPFTTAELARQAKEKEDKRKQDVNKAKTGIARQRAEKNLKVWRRATPTAYQVDTGALAQSINELRNFLQSNRSDNAANFKKWLEEQMEGVQEAIAANDEKATNAASVADSALATATESANLSSKVSNWISEIGLEKSGLEDGVKNGVLWFGEQWISLPTFFAGLTLLRGLRFVVAEKPDKDNSFADMFSATGEPRVVYGAHMAPQGESIYTDDAVVTFVINAVTATPHLFPGATDAAGVKLPVDKDGYATVVANTYVYMQDKGYISAAPSLRTVVQTVAYLFINGWNGIAGTIFGILPESISGIVSSSHAKDFVGSK